MQGLWAFCVTAAPLSFGVKPRQHVDWAGAFVWLVHDTPTLKWSVSQGLPQNLVRNQVALIKVLHLFVLLF